MAQDGNAAPTGAELARSTRPRLIAAVAGSNMIGGLTAFAFGVISPFPAQPDNETGLLLLNLAVFLILGPAAIWLGFTWARRAVADPIERWLLAERPPTEEERDLVLRQPILVAGISVNLWGLAALAFTAVNATESAELAASAGVVALLGGVTSSTVAYLLVERISRPLVARALADGAPVKPVAPGVALRLMMTWTLVTGVPLLGIAAIAIADLSGVHLDTTTAVAILMLAAVGLVAGSLSTLVAARAVADPVRAVRRAMGRVEEGGFETRVPVDDAGEVGQLEAGFNSMAAGLAERERLRDLFGRHVGHEVARAALEDEVRLGGELREVAVLFVDVIGSTKLAARRPAAEVVALLNAFFKLVVESVESHGGWINKFEGDAALCVFGAPAPAEDPAGDALAAARDLRDRLAAGLPELEAGIGVSAGRAVAGNVGAEHRFEYTVIGDPVNEAARLCELAKRRPERLLASAATLRRARDSEGERWSLADEVTLRGRDEPTRLALPVAR
ncbi:MAG: HAMP domain-containing protein [Thermoleophilaceae bacterium]|nr:HAMP domain-containing protein [Thermoleophilaceae bacterium]